MSLRTLIAAAAASAALALPALAGDMIMVKDPYARTSMKSAATGAAFMQIMNKAGEDDRLVSASSDISERVELHTHIESGDGVMQMVEVEGGFVIPAGGMHALARGGDHVMFLELKEPLEQGDTVTVTLSFEKAGDMVVEIPVDLERKPMHGKKHKMNNDG